MTIIIATFIIAIIIIIIIIIIITRLASRLDQGGLRWNDRKRLRHLQLPSQLVSSLRGLRAGNFFPPPPLSAPPLQMHLMYTRIGTIPTTCSGAVFRPSKMRHICCVCGRAFAVCRTICVRVCKSASECTQQGEGRCEAPLAFGRGLLPGTRSQAYPNGLIRSMQTGNDTLGNFAHRPR